MWLSWGFGILQDSGGKGGSCWQVQAVKLRGPGKLIVLALRLLGVSEFSSARNLLLQIRSALLVSNISSALMLVLVVREVRWN